MAQQSRPRGFAAMDEEQQREIARKGGQAAHASGHAHEFTSEEAAEAGRKGGETVSQDREHMAEIGRKGGLAAHHRNAAFYHETAAHHHREAAHHHERGDTEEGERHGKMAHSHSQTAHEHSQKSRRGFAAMDPEERSEIARKGGEASHGGRGRDYNRDEYDEEESRGSGNGRRNQRDEEEDYQERGRSTRGGTSEQHARAGRQSHKNS